MKPYRVTPPRDIYLFHSPLIWTDMLATPAYLTRLPDKHPAFPPAYIVPAYINDNPFDTLRFAIAATTALTYDRRLVMYNPDITNNNLLLAYTNHPDDRLMLPEKLIVPALHNATNSLPPYILRACNNMPASTPAIYAAFLSAYQHIKYGKAAIGCSKKKAPNFALNACYPYAAYAAINCLNAALNIFQPACLFMLLADGKIIAADNPNYKPARLPA